jgi:nucleoside-diphosphate-sugar epimerase
MSESPRLVITGAAGFLGTRLIRTLRDRYRIVAIDREPPGEIALAEDPNVQWHRIDLADGAAVRETFDRVRREGGARALFHFAAYYDFTGEEHREYQRTNIDAMRIVLENSCDLGLDRFIFASSVAACEYPAPGEAITEKTPPHGPHVYAISKRAGEEMLHEFADRVPSCIVRFAAMFSDWCEYPPLYFFMDTWLSDRWNARLLGGRGRSAIPFLHVRDATVFLRRVLDRAGDLEGVEVLNASTNGAISHQQLFEVATEHYFGKKRKPIHVPRILCGPGMWGRDLMGRILGNRPFERPWMAGHIDRQLTVDATHTQQRLDWKPHERLDILRRIPFMIENTKTSPMEWNGRNLEALEHHDLRPRFRVYRLVQKYEVEVDRRYAELLAEQENPRLLTQDLETIRRSAMRALVQAIRTGEKSPFTLFCRELTERRVKTGARFEEVVSGIRALEQACLETLRKDEEAAELKRELDDLIEFTIAFGIDQIQEIYEDQGAGAV